MPCDGNDYVTNFRDGTLTLEDGAGHTMVVALDMGDLAISGLTAGQAEVAVYKPRGRTKAIRLTNQTEPTLSFSAMLNRLTASEAAGRLASPKRALLDFLLFRGASKGNTRTGGVCGDVPTLNAKWTLNTVDGPEYVLVKDVHFSVDTAEGDPNMISASGTIYNADVEIIGAV
jgi:hypothetical protein